jgi:hypothetical protein
MKPSEMLLSWGKPIAYYPGLAKKVGGVKAAILFCQLFFWTGKEKAKDGWVYKSQEELETETGLSPKEQRTAREALTNCGILEERNQRTEHRIYYRIILELLDKILVSEHVPVGSMPTEHVSDGNRASAQPALGKCPSGVSLKGTAENTQENTKREDGNEKPVSGEVPPAVKTFDPDEPDPLKIKNKRQAKNPRLENENWPVMHGIYIVTNIPMNDQKERVGAVAKKIRDINPEKSGKEIEQAMVLYFGRENMKTNYWYNAPNGLGRINQSYPCFEQVHQHWQRAVEWTQAKSKNTKPRYTEEV